MSDYERAVQWYEELLGGPPTMIPTEGEAVWRLTDSASLYVVVDDERAGSSVAAIAVVDLGALGVSREDDGPVIVFDPDGNRLTLFEA